ncbi:MAG: hypothetical protein GY759_20170 [Chloroflexi bacterium]|nr:hypothetical protein [Chloroflexota bacterium]
MGPFDLFDALLGPINPINRILGAISAVAHTNTGKAKTEGVSSVVAEAVGNATGVNLYQFSIPRNGVTTLQGARALLKQYGIPTFRLLHNHENFYFSVKRNQARWAEYLMYQKGIHLSGPTFDARNTGYPDLHEPGYMPRPWIENNHTAQPDQSAGDFVAETEKNKKGGVSRLHSHLDRIDAIFLDDDELKVIRTRGYSQKKEPHSQDHARRPTDWFDQMNALIDRWL